MDIFVSDMTLKKLSTMEIAEIKQQLSLSQVLKHYNLKPDKNQRMSCPFHPDKTPSMQVYYKTQTAYCFSSNCKTHGKSLDVIDFVMYMESLDKLGAEGKHKAIEKAELMLNGNHSSLITLSMPEIS